tara:strand:- start:873 stop:989 length:117 start_codon:yes stop_codon:yes gene_type:complete
MGIGEAIAKRLAKDGANIVLMSRSKVSIYSSQDLAFAS